MNNLLYTAREFDFDTGLQFNRMRYYNCNLGRFIQKDLKYDKYINYYIYAINNPVQFYDPFGLSIWGWIKEALSNLIAGLIELLLCPEDPMSCGQEYYYCIEDCVRCCERTFPTNSPDPYGTCRSKFQLCLVHCNEATNGQCVPPPYEETGQY